ncbi:MAG: hypothetical protein ORN29_03520 [Rhodoferax sp.]|nr:hypothetical protein [Rhodoferax sp.]
MPARPRPIQPEALPTKKQRLVSGGLLVLATLILVAVFLLYTRSGFLLDMGNQVWGCF